MGALSGTCTSLTALFVAVVVLNLAISQDSTGSFFQMLVGIFILFGWCVAFVGVAIGAWVNSFGKQRS